MLCNKKIWRLINRGLIAVDAILTNIYKRVWHIKLNEKKVLIVFQQIFGDAVLLSDSLHAYEHLYPIKDDYTISMVARPTVTKFMKEVLPLPADITIDTVDFSLFVENYKYYREIKRKYSDKFGTIIVPGTSLSAEIFSTICAAKKRIGLVRSIPNKWPPSVVMFQKLAYTERVCPDKELMMLQRHRLLIHHLGMTCFKAQLPKLLVQSRFINEEYCVICPGASKMEKCWPVERFARVVDYIVETYGFKVVLCGGAEDAKFEQDIIVRVKRQQWLESYIGKTTFSEWSSIVQHAKLVLGNDSATIHLAAAANVPAICIAGVYDKLQFFPYKVDYLEEREHLPITIMKDMPCAWCRTRGYYSGFENRECKKEIDNDRCALCIKEITTEEVIAAVEQVFEV